MSLEKTYFGFAFLLFIILFLSGCSKDPDTVISDLKDDILNLPIDTNDKQEATESLLTKIQKLEDDENDKRVQILSKDTKNAIIRTSANSATLVANIDGSWIILTNTKLHSKGGSAAPVQINTSYHGQYVLYAVDNDNQCIYSIIDLGDDGSKFDVQNEILKISCEASAVVDDKGQIFFTRSNDVFRYSIPDKKETLILGKSLFKSNYPKIENKLYLVAIPDGLWLLFGAAGYYDLYYYNGTPNSARKIYPAVASPSVQYSANSLFSLDSDLIENQSSKVQLAQEPATLFLYSGEAGRYQLQGFRLPATPWKSFRVPIKKTVYYLSNFDQFLYIKNNYPIRYDINTAKESKLPLRANQIFVHQSGLVYTNDRHQLVLRKEPYSDFEKKLFQLKEELEQNLR